MLAPAAINAIILGNHTCRNKWVDEVGDEVGCHHHLWDRRNEIAVAALRKQREQFLALGTRARAKTVLEALSFESSRGAQQGWAAPVQRVVYRVGTSVDRMREVCREVFLANYPVGLATLKRRVKEKRLGKDLYQSAEGEDAPTSVGSLKALHAIAWWRGYAEQTSEKLPDVNMQLTPFRYLKDIYAVRAIPYIASSKNERVAVACKSASAYLWKTRRGWSL
eukprot:6205385-Pleurochrysis_carterae.AAC.1